MQKSIASAGNCLRTVKASPEMNSGEISCPLVYVSKVQRIVDAVCSILSSLIIQGPLCKFSLLYLNWSVSRTQCGTGTNSFRFSSGSQEHSQWMLLLWATPEDIVTSLSCVVSFLV